MDCPDTLELDRADYPSDAQIDEIYADHEESKADAAADAWIAEQE